MIKDIVISPTTYVVKTLQEPRVSDALNGLDTALNDFVSLITVISPLGEDIRKMAVPEQTRSRSWRLEESHSRPLEYENQELVEDPPNGAGTNLDAVFRAIDGILLSYHQPKDREIDFSRDPIQSLKELDKKQMAARSHFLERFKWWINRIWTSRSLLPPSFWNNVSEERELRTKPDPRPGLLECTKNWLKSGCGLGRKKAAAAVGYPDDYNFDGIMGSDGWIRYDKRQAKYTNVFYALEELAAKLIRIGISKPPTENQEQVIPYWDLVKWLFNPQFGEQVLREIPTRVVALDRTYFDELIASLERISLDLKKRVGDLETEGDTALALAIDAGTKEISLLDGFSSRFVALLSVLRDHIENIDRVHAALNLVGERFRDKFLL